MEPLPTVIRTTAAQDVTVRLRDAITRGQMSPGTQLRETSLARELGVGRAPIREALRQLMQEGLVTHQPHRGSVVTVLTEHDLADIYIAREGIEPQAVSLIVEQGAKADVGPVRAALERLRRAPRGPRPTIDVVEADIALHETIVEAAGSPRLHRMFRTLSAEMRMYLLQAHPPYDPETYIADHVRLAESIIAQQADAPELMRAHLRYSRSVIGDAMTRDSKHQSEGT